MAATLKVQFIDPPDPTLPSPEPIQALLTQAFQAWTSHFDYTADSVTVNVFSSWLCPAAVARSRL